ncbi:MULTISPECIES: TlpA family protein disulfide reductase [Nocardioides]|uniref:TlpA family protein disulfide reductase n=1 Tax=Nocardioides vastitatis TaxID=2568655 RepID=A0ABW0ZG76_9ACTN|nr:TlpA disulfide reductase family protein [Nocardioides sp.]THI97331.1 TlpA family protein disulfide reductase [Nocardioides sp.]
MGPGRSTAVRAAGVLAVAVLLAGCDQAEPALACKIEVDTPELQADREAAGIADCRPDGSAADPDGRDPEGAPVADLPDVSLACLGSESRMALSEVRGPAMINFWASNCGPCREELPALQEFHETYGSQVTVLGVDYLDTYPGAAIDLARQSGVTYPSLADACGDLQSTDLVILGLPQFVLVAEDGTVTQVSGGVDSVDDLVVMVDQHLGIDLAAGTPERTGR